jgi:hypothetical protein
MSKLLDIVIRTKEASAVKPKKAILVTVAVSILISASSYIPARARSVDQAACALIDQNRPAQFVSYEGASQPAREVTLRIHNNTSCSIIVETDDRSPTLLTRLPNGRVKAEAVTGSLDGARLDLHYLVQNRKGWRAAQPAYGWGDSVFTYALRPGQSAIFGVPMSQFRKRLDVAVPFKYAWEGDRAIAMGVGGVAHRVYFLVEDVPASALRSNARKEPLKRRKEDVH